MTQHDNNWPTIYNLLIASSNNRTLYVAKEDSMDPLDAGGINFNSFPI